jgi:transcription elongation factor Elf1
MGPKEREIRRLKTEIEKLKVKKEEHTLRADRYKTTTYCTHCMRVRGVLIPKGNKVGSSNCVYCGSYGTCHQVITIE